MAFSKYGKIPETLARLDPSLVIRAYDVDVNGEKGYGRIIGAVQKFARDEHRNVKVRKSLGKDGMRPFKIIPQGVEVELTLGRVALYREETLRDVGKIDGSLIYQSRPLIIQEVQRSTMGRSDIFEYHDCWFTSNPITYDISAADLLVIQELKVKCAYMEPLGEGFSGIPFLVTGSVEILKKGFKF